MSRVNALLVVARPYTADVRYYQIDLLRYVGAYLKVIREKYSNE